MQHLMIDVELMDEKHTAAITGLSAVFFDPTTGEVGKQFYRRISLDDCMSNGGTVSAHAIQWWLRQPSEVRSQILDDDCQDIELAICDLYGFIIENSDAKYVKTWFGCPSMHSKVIHHYLDRFAGQCFLEANEQSVITMVTIAEELGLNMNSIIKYDFQRNSLAHALHNIKIVSYIWMFLGIKNSVK
ncbi:3'-5' exonuclease [Escherichia coli]|uniref:3'-5' exonuclease n=1 Tax=Escherichia coli TaxID=562 RepID=UPI0002A2BC52|nr:3'-5' exonuclease [Escherichia coli]ELD68715.1 hypothetical protein A193_03386 [Escherichia coli KTE234]